MLNSLNLIKSFLFRFLSVVFIQIVLITGLVFGNHLPAIAENAPSKPYYLNRDNLKNTHTKQAQKSYSAKTKEEPESFKDTLVEKLNLNEPRPESTKKVIDQLKGNLPIEDTTHPDANY